MAKIKMKFSADGNTFKVANVCSDDSKDCVGDFKSVVAGACQMDDTEVEYTDEYYVGDELPPQQEQIPVNEE